MTTSNKVQWNQASGDVWDKGGRVQTSKCGRYRIAKEMVAASRNGHWKAEYTLLVLRPDGSVQYKLDGLEKGAKAMAQEDADERAGLLAQ